MSQSETSFPVTTGLVKEFVNVDSRGFALSFAVTAMVCVASGVPQKSFLLSYENHIKIHQRQSDRFLEGKVDSYSGVTVEHG